MRMKSNRLGMVIVSFLMLASMLVPVSGSVRATAGLTEVVLAALDFAGPGNSPQASFSTTSTQVAVTAQDFSQQLKANGAGAEAAGAFTRFTASPGEDVYAVMQAVYLSSPAFLERLNSLTPGDWSITVGLDYDILSSGNDAANRPEILFRFKGETAVAGQSGIKDYRPVDSVGLKRLDIHGDQTFSHYSVTVPLHLYSARNAADNNSGLNNQLLAGSITSSQFDIRLRSLPAAAVPMTVDIDNITITAISGNAYSPTGLNLEKSGAEPAQPGQSMNVVSVLTDKYTNQPVANQEVVLRASTPFMAPVEVGTAYTAVNGAVYFPYTPAYPGEYTFTAEFKTDDTARLMGSTATAIVQVTEEWNAPPAVFRVTDAVKPGELLTVYGEAITGAVEVAVLEAGGIHGAPAYTTAAASATVIQTDPQGHYVTARLPSAGAPGGYYVWVKNDHGWSEAVMLNAVRPQWISEDRAAAGLAIKVMGRNLDGREFGAAESTLVRLAGGMNYQAAVTEVNPFAVTFTIPSAVPAGTYTVEVSNDGLNYAGLEEGQQLTIVPAGDDPLGLGVAWAYDFDWSRVYNVLAYGAAGDSVTDDTYSIQSAIQAAKAAGGGVVYFPEGTYNISVLTLPAHIVLMGESKETSVLNYVPPAAATQNELQSWTVIKSTGEAGHQGYQGLARLKLTMDAAATDKPLPNIFVSLGNGWLPEDVLARTARNLFLKDFSLDYRVELGPWTKTGSPGFISLSAKGHVLLADSYFRGYFPGPSSSWIGEYVQLTDNIWDDSNGNTYLPSAYTVIENNSIKRTDPSVDASKQGFFTRGPAYVAHNSISNTGSLSSNDGEIVSAENFRGGLKMMGGVVSAGTATLTVYPKTDSQGNLLGAAGKNVWAIDKRPWGSWYVVITDGKGMGQYRELTEYLGGQEYAIAKPWDVIPDTTSKFAIVLPNKMVTMYANTALNNANTFQLYGDSLDGVMQGNILTDSEGFYTHSIYFEKPENQDSRFAVAYFTRVKDNVMSGVSWRSNVGTITFYSLNETHDPFAYTMYGIDIKGNQLTGISDAARFLNRNYFNGISIGSIHNKVKPTRPVIKNAVIENNSLSHMNRGITIGAPGPAWEANASYIGNIHASGVAGVVIADNTFDHVDREIADDYMSGNVTILEP